MKKGFSTALVFSSALLFTMLFYKKPAGINLLIFELFVLGCITWIQKESLKSIYSRFIFSGILLSAIAFVINYTALAFIVNLLSLFIFTGVLIYPHAKSMVGSVELAFSNLLLSFRKQFQDFGEMKAAGISVKSVFHYFKILFLPIVIIFLFLIIYSISSPYFSHAFDAVSEFFLNVLNQLDIEMAFVFVLGSLCSTFLLVRVPVFSIINKNELASFDLVRRKQRRPLLNPFLFKREITSALFLLVILNGLIFVVNILDIYHVWFNFTWQGNYLKQFVHEGTYLLILSILISIGIVLYFFRGNINFYSKSGALKKLAVAWLVQNAVLALSVGVRNFWYIQYFSLAYKRIGVIFFLLLTLYGIYTVIVKIRNRQSPQFLFARNSLSLYCVLLLMSFVNWDSVIARYNFSHYRTSFIHYDFLSGLPSKTLPYLDKSIEELDEIDSWQEKLFRFENEYMTSVRYYDIIAYRKNNFKSYWQSKGFLSWNYAEYKASKLLK